MDYWNIGILGHHIPAPSFHYSNIPLFQLRRYELGQQNTMKGQQANSFHAATCPHPPEFYGISSFPPEGVFRLFPDDPKRPAH